MLGSCPKVTKSSKGAASEASRPIPSRGGAHVASSKSHVFSAQIRRKKSEFRHSNLATVTGDRSCIGNAELPMCARHECKEVTGLFGASAILTGGRLGVLLAFAWSSRRQNGVERSKLATGRSARWFGLRRTNGMAHHPPRDSVLGRSFTTLSTR